jgi:hypothetical protein
MEWWWWYEQKGGSVPNVGRPICAKCGKAKMCHFGKGHETGFPVLFISHNSGGAKSKLCCRQGRVDAYLE